MSHKNGGRGQKRGGEEWSRAFPEEKRQEGEGQGGSSSTSSSANKKPRKVPALASVIVEALKLDSLQRLCSSLEPLLRRIVSEEVERALANLGQAKLTARSSPQRIGPPEGRRLQLHFRSPLPPHLFTGAKVEGEKGAAIHVVLLDASNGSVISSGPESMAKLDVVVLEGDFNEENDSDWTAEIFDGHELKEREGKRPLLTGDLQVTLKEGVGTLGNLSFTDNSSWIRSRKFRLGLKISAGFCEGFQIREAKTEAFAVKDHRGELYKKHYPPALHDEVWRLDRIAKDGSLHKKLVDAKILTVEDFLRLLVRDPQKLRQILGSGMSNRMWDSTVEHAKTCVLGGKLYVYYYDETRTTGALFDDIYELRGLITSEQFLSIEELSQDQKVSVDVLVKRAYENWNHVVEYDSQLLLSSINGGKKGHPLRPTTINHPPSTDQYFMPTTYSQNYYASNTETSFSNGRAETNSSELTLPNLQELRAETYLSEDWSQSKKGQGFDDIFSEEDIRMRSSEILEHDDMQNLLRSIGMGNGAGRFDDTAEACYSYCDTPSEPKAEHRFRQKRNNAKAVVGWLKLKAAFRWGIFIRKKAAERRAQLVELD